MRILYFALRACWPPNGGALLRDYNLARQLASRGDVTFVGMREAGELPSPEPPASSGIRDLQTFVRERSYSPRKLIGGILGPDPITVLNYSSAAVALKIERLLKERLFDTVQIEGVHLLRYVPVIRAADPRVAVIADWHNIESELLSRYASKVDHPAKRLYALRTSALIRRAETRLLTGCDHHTVTSERERAALLARSPGALVSTIPNGVDVGLLDPGDREADDGSKRDIIFVGSMDYHANVDAVRWMAREVWPIVRSRASNLRFVIVGRDPGASILELAADDIVVTGTVEDIRPYYRSARTVVVPLRVGSGTRLKILEAMASRVPIVSTPLGAEGIDLEDGVNVLLAPASAPAFAEAVLRLDASSELRQQLARSGFRLVHAKYDWSGIGATLFDVHRAARTARDQQLPLA